METLNVAKSSFYIGIISSIVAVGYVAPVVLGLLVSPTGHNIINSPPDSILTDYQTWPSLWMFVGFSVFILAAVVGSYAWSFIYYLSSSLFVKQQRINVISVLQILVYTIGVYLSTAFMIYTGYTEGLSIARGASPLVVAGSVQWTVIPHCTSCGPCRSRRPLGRVEYIYAIQTHGWFMI